MDPYVDYARQLLAQGTPENEIMNDLLARGLNPQTADELLSMAAKAPASEAQSAAKPAKPAPFQSVRRPAAANLPVSTDEAPAYSRPGAFKGYFLTFIICLIPLVVIAFDQPWASRFGTTITTLLTLADMFGMIGLTLYVIDLVLATRLAWLEDLFGGLNKVYIAHAVIGSLSLLAILIHPLLYAVRYLPLGVSTVAGVLLPSWAHVATAYGIFGLYAILILLIVTLYVHLPYRLWLWSHKLLGVAYFLVVLHVLFEPNAITGNPFLRYYVIAIALLGLVAFIYRTLLPNVLVKRYVYIVEAVTPKATGVVQISLRPTDKAMRFEAGQFIFISFHADGLSPEWHPFTIVSPPSSGSLSIDVKSLGAYTETMTRILPDMVGMTAFIEGAYGRFSFRNFKNPRQIWVAGGIGITPFISMAQALGKGPYNIDLYYAVKSEAELIDIATLARAQTNRPNQTFRLIPFVTDKYNQFLSADIIEANSGNLDGRDFLICGPPVMMASLRQQLLKKGVKKFRLHTEEFSIT